MKSLSRIATWGLVGLIAVNVVGAGYYFAVQRQLRNTKLRQALSLGSAFPVLSSGVDVRGGMWEPRHAPCRVIRITEDGCSFCRKDKPSYEKLLDAARAASCEIIEIAPHAGGMAYDPRAQVVQLKFVDADIGSVLFPFVTPQTIVLDDHWSVKLTKRGTFDKGSLASAVALLSGFVESKSSP